MSDDNPYRFRGDVETPTVDLRGVPDRRRIVVPFRRAVLAYNFVAAGSVAFAAYAFGLSERNELDRTTETLAGVGGMAAFGAQIVALAEGVKVIDRVAVSLKKPKALLAMLPLVNLFVLASVAEDARRANELADARERGEA